MHADSDASPQTAPHCVVVMGVSGSGKSTVGVTLADRLGLPFIDGDDLHPTANVEKMSHGIPLTDDDRWPWLRSVGQWLSEHPSGGVVACSALKRSYRDSIRELCPDAVFVHCDGTRELLLERMSQRVGHFMPVALLDSQLDTLETLQADEPGRAFDIAASPALITDEIIDWLRNQHEDEPGSKHP